jgi:hypothetical protein
MLGGDKVSDPTGSRQPVIGSEAELPPPPGPPPFPSQPEPPRQPRFQPINRDQWLLRPVEVEKLVAPDHLVRAIGELTGRLDLTASTVVRV